MRFPSITPVDAGTMNFLTRKLRSLGFKCKILEFKSKNSKPVKNLYARLGKSRPNFCYAGHTDVVPPGNLNDWTVNPFKPAVKGNHLIGRGANDMKASVACFVAAVSKFKSKKFKGSISLLITGDEEGIAINGTKRVVEYLKRKKEKIDFCLVGEPTNQNKLGEMMKIGRRGSITGYLTVCGIQGHVAYPHDANNPAPVMTKILNQIENIKLDKGTKNFQSSNLEIVKINIENTADNVLKFIIERIRGYFAEQKFAGSVIEAVLAVSSNSPSDMQQRIAAVAAFQRLPESKALASANKRIANILRKNSIEGVSSINAALLQDPVFAYPGSKVMSPVCDRRPPMSTAFSPRLPSTTGNSWVLPW